eukprot:CAMPEP_0170776838 /NCGR_PEP_ID=MMETSP0733-20121128/11410_1 /TAXON_ID=186038 /ORGANISM="Fragilariopsis kerguelensis, Strain L26-C5" /LENGTH=116 /DNA_ID=CAMNT_0011119899 /DNA_START=16 /DNA_END=366 /DNA_ORIENTATION=+
MSEEKKSTVTATIVDADRVPSSSDSNEWENNIDRFMEECMMCGMWMGEQAQGAQCQLIETEKRVEEFLLVRTNTIEDNSNNNNNNSKSKQWNDSLVTQYRSRQIVYNYEMDGKEMI